jgi:hypothetical protein
LGAAQQLPSLCREEKIWRLINETEQEGGELLGERAMARGAESGGPTAEGRGESGSSNLLGFFLTSALSAYLWPWDTHSNLLGRFAPGVPAGHAGQLVLTGRFDP